MIKTLFPALAWGIALCGVPALPQPPHPPAITSISVCSATGAGGQGSCPSGSFDTHQMVLGPGGSSVNSGLNVGPAPDEHSSVFAPGTLGSNQDYLFFLATAEGGHAAIGVAVLSGGSGPAKSGQWTLDFPKADAYGSYAGGFGQVFNPSGPVDKCPVVADGNPAHQDQTFDMHYAAPGSIVKDPTSAPGGVLMVYEGTNACIGNAGGPVLSNEDDYISLAIATSLDYGKTWPTYRGTPIFSFVPLPGFSQTQGPNAPMGALGKNVCMGNDCTSTPPASYGRYPVVTSPTSLTSLMAAAKPLTAKYGEQEISGFVDDVAGSPAPYLYVNSGDVRVARAQLNSGTAPLTFLKWDGHAFASPGLGGAESSVLPAGPFENCEGPAQNQFGSSIGYVEDTQQYLLTFLCDSPGDPALGQRAGAARGAAWFYSTSYDLSDQTQWTAPREIVGSWSEFDQSGGCPDYKGYYPTFMSLGKSAGHLSLAGYVFYLWGCQGAGTPGGRQFSSRAFTITTANASGLPTASTVNAASFDASALASGAIASLFGSGLSDGTAATTSTNLPTSLARVTVTVKDSAGNTQTAPLFFVSPGQINFLVPTGLANGSATIAVLKDSVAVAASTIQLATVAPALFSANADGKGAAAAYFATAAKAAVFAFTCGATPGSCVTAPFDLSTAPGGAVLVLYGTGLRNNSGLSSVAVTIGGLPATAVYAGPQNQYPGLDQINVQVPAGLAGKGEVDVAVAVNGAPANKVRVAFK